MEYTEVEQVDLTEPDVLLMNMIQTLTEHVRDLQLQHIREKKNVTKDIQPVFDYLKNIPSMKRDKQTIFTLMEQYQMYKSNYVSNLKFDPRLDNFSMYLNQETLNINKFNIFSGDHRLRSTAVNPDLL